MTIQTIALPAEPDGAIASDAAAENPVGANAGVGYQEVSMNRRSLLQLSGLMGLGTLASCMTPPDSLLVQTNGTEALPEPLIMQLDWVFNVQFAGLLLADHLGLYRQHGLNVVIQDWESQQVITEVVAATPRMIGCAEQNLILDAQAKGMPLKAIAAMFQASPYGLMSLPDRGITTLGDLQGERVGVHVDGLKVMELVQGISGITEIEVVEIPYQNKLDRLLSGEFAALQCYAVDEPIGFLRQVGELPTVLPMDEYGYIAYAQVLFTTDELLEQQSESLRDFLSASFAGWTIALNDVFNTAQTVVQEYVDPTSSYFDLEYQLQSLELVKAYVLRNISESQIGTISPDRWQEAAMRMAGYNIIESLPDLESSIDLSLWSGT
ncbi:ABC transporter substrate-binding protein [Egbenema bharatensis]|uniref:ABC transporter substrate-binding protein n=1 Tax=Egbenema bharatensis TaxID=3463334 RepID=UPI003A891867